MNENPGILDDDFVGLDKYSDEYKYKLAALRLLQKKVNRAGNFLFAIGLITLLTKAIPYLEEGQYFNLLAYIIFGCFYLAMGFLSTIKPIIALSIALLVYLSLFVVIVIINPSVSALYFIIRILVSAVLIVGIINAFKITRLKTKYGITDL